MKKQVYPIDIHEYFKQVRKEVERRKKLKNYKHPALQKKPLGPKQE